MNNHEQNLGKLIKQQRLMIPLTCQELAAKSGVSASHLGRIERGNRFPSARILGKIAKPLGLTEDELFRLAGYLPPIEGEAQPGRLDPYVAGVLSQEPVEMQRTVFGILSILKSMAEGIGFVKYVHWKYPEVDEDTITMIKDILEHPPKG